MIIHCLAHVPFEDAANIGRWAHNHGHSLNYTRFFQNDPLPSIDRFDMLAVMGGPMNVSEHDIYPWLVTEKEFIKKSIDKGKKIIGVCLGAQLIADCLGATVTPNPQKEIGWHPVTLTEAAQKSPLFAHMPTQMDVFHWHGDTFSIPPEAIHLAASRACANQAFLYGRNVLALQFHMEYSRQSIEKMLNACGSEIIDAPYIQHPEIIRAGCDRIPQTSERLYALLDAFARL